MSRTIINIEEMVMSDGDQSIIYFRIQEPRDVPECDRSRQLPYRPTDPPFTTLAALQHNDGASVGDGLVRAAGTHVHNGLKIHPGVEYALTRAVLGAAHESQPIYIETTALDSEALPWEVLYHPQGKFLSLNPNWPMARITGSRQFGEQRRNFNGDLVVAAVLAASGVKAGPEWEALLAALETLPCRLTVFVAEKELHDQIQGLSLDWVTVEMVPTTESDLVDRLRTIKPQVLHFFCHGSSDAYLQVATRNQLELGHEPIYLSGNDLRVLKDSVWLAVLNCCEGAATTETHSLAYSLVDEGVPAAVGMREAVASDDASVFSRAFYEGLASYFKHRLRPGVRLTVDWASLMPQPRRELCRKHGNLVDAIAPHHKEWTLPVLYRRPEELIIEVANNPALSDNDKKHLFAQLDTVRTVRAAMHPSTPGDKLAAIDGLIQQLEAELRVNDQ